MSKHSAKTAGRSAKTTSRTAKKSAKSVRATAKKGSARLPVGKATRPARTGTPVVMPATATKMIRTPSPPVQPVAMHEMPVRLHKYQVGETVYYTSPTFGRTAASGSYIVVKLLPSEGDDYQYPDQELRRGLRTRGQREPARSRLTFRCRISCRDFAAAVPYDARVGAVAAPEEDRACRSISRRGAIPVKP